MENGNKLKDKLTADGSAAGNIERREKSSNPRRVMQRRKLTIRSMLGHLGTKLPWVLRSQAYRRSEAIVRDIQILNSFLRERAVFAQLS
jgi:hypothetical protein